ncbi:MAG: hypothetical protein ABEK03_10250 [Candidatus Bipolaricaulia bacterium]
MKQRVGLTGIVAMLVLLVAYTASASPTCSSSVHAPVTPTQQSARASDCGCGDQASEAGADVSAHCSSCATAALPTLDLVPRTTAWVAVIPLSLPSPIDVPSRLDRPPQV